MFDSGAPGMLGNVDRVWGCGGAFSSNPLFRQELRSSVFGDTVVSFDRTADAAYGATLAVTTTFWQFLLIEVLQGGVAIALYDSFWSEMM